MRKILITGANGFIGSHLVSHCIQANYQVLAGVRKGSDLSNLEERDIPIVCLDYLNQQQLTNQLRQECIDYIIHAAGVIVAKTPNDYEKGIYTTTKNLLMAAHNIGLKKFIFISSLAARGPGMFSEDHPISLYGKYKLETEKLVENSALPFLNVRPTGVYGPKNLEFFPLFKWASQGIIINLGDKNRKLSFIHVADLCEIILDAIKGEAQLIYASDGKTYTLAEMNVILKQITGKRHYVVLPIAKWIFRVMMSVAEFFVSTVFGNTWDYPRGKVEELIADDWSIHHQGECTTFQHDLRSGFLDTVSYYAKVGWI